MPLQEERRRKAEARLPVSSAKNEEEEFVCTMAVPEVKRRLRRIGHPITLFGETDAQREKRLKDLEATMALRESETAETGRNEFLEDIRGGNKDEKKGGAREELSDTEEDGQLLDKAACVSKLFAAIPPGTDEQTVILHFLQVSAGFGLVRFNLFLFCPPVLCAWWFVA